MRSTPNRSHPPAHQQPPAPETLDPLRNRPPTLLQRTHPRPARSRPQPQPPTPPARRPPHDPRPTQAPTSAHSYHERIMRASSPTHLPPHRRIHPPTRHISSAQRANRASRRRPLWPARTQSRRDSLPSSSTVMSTGGGGHAQARSSHRGQRGARRRVARRAQEVSEGDPRRGDLYSARLHPPDADELDWLTGPSTGHLDIGRERSHLPSFFQKVNSSGVRVRILVAQGIVITLIGLLYALLPSVSRAYWILAAHATEVYMIIYVLMFVAARNLRRRQPEHARGYQIRLWQRSAQTGPSPPSVPA